MVSRVHSHAAAALINFCEGVERDALVPYLDPIVERLLKLLNPSGDDAKQPKVGDAAYPYTGRSGYECMPSYYSDAAGPFGRNLESTARIRAAVRQDTQGGGGLSTPVVAAGGIHSFEQAEACLASGQADIVGFARQALADPDWFRKVVTGHGSQVRLCLYTNY